MLKSASSEGWNDHARREVLMRVLERLMSAVEIQSEPKLPHFPCTNLIQKLSTSNLINFLFIPGINLHFAFVACMETLIPQNKLQNLKRHINNAW